MAQPHNLQQRPQRPQRQVTFRCFSLGGLKVQFKIDTLKGWTGNDVYA